MGVVPEISVVVPTYRRPALLAACVRSLAQQDLAPERYEVVVVNDGSDDATTEVVQRSAQNTAFLSYIDLPSNRGPAAARNQGANASQGKVILFVDDDIVAPPDLLSTHLRYHQSGDDRLGVVGLVEWLPTLRTTPFMRWLDTTDLQFAYWRMKEGLVEPPWDAFYTCNLSLPRAILAQVGGFDERFPYAAYEDAELAIRLSKVGFRLEYRPKAVAWHAREMTLQSFCERMKRVGEAAVILTSLQSDFRVLKPTDFRESSVVHRVALRLLKPAALALPNYKLRNKYYHAIINEAFRQGVAKGRSRIA